MIQENHLRPDSVCRRGRDGAVTLCLPSLWDRESQKQTVRSKGSAGVAGPVHHRGRLEPQQLENSGWVRAVGGVVAVQLATDGHAVTSSHQLLHLQIRCRRMSEHVTLHRPVKIVVTRHFQPRKRTGDAQTQVWTSEKAVRLHAARARSGLGLNAA